MDLLDKISKNEKRAINILASMTDENLKLNIKYSTGEKKKNYELRLSLEKDRKSICDNVEKEMYVEFKNGEVISMSDSYSSEFVENFLGAVEKNFLYRE